MSIASALVGCTQHDRPGQVCDLPSGDPEFDDIRADVDAYVAEVTSGRIRPRNRRRGASGRPRRPRT